MTYCCASKATRGVAIAKNRIGLLLVTGVQRDGHPVNSVCFSPDGRVVASCATDGAVHLLGNPKQLRLAPVLSYPHMEATDFLGHVTFSDRSNTVYFVSRTGSLWKWQVPAQIECDGDDLLA